MDALQTFYRHVGEHDRLVNRSLHAIALKCGFHDGNLGVTGRARGQHWGQQSNFTLFSSY